MTGVQTCALPIYPGNSGGPLLDQTGRVIGINVAVSYAPEGGQGIGFAIPSNTAKRIADLLLEKGEVPRGFLGVEMTELPAPQAKALKIDNGGVIVKNVVKGGPAEEAGIKTGDIIVRVNNDYLQRFRPIRHLRQIVGDLDPGTEVPVEIVRGEERRQVTVTLGKQPASFR